jgi:hypothetical protein
MKRVTNYVRNTITDITEEMKKIDKCFDKVQLRGSAEEGLKVLYPDEFDFVLLNQRWMNIISYREDENTPGYAYAIENEGSSCRSNANFPLVKIDMLVNQI